VLYKSSGSPGVYSFTVTLAAGGRESFRGKRPGVGQDYHDDRNYVLFHLDKNDFRRIQLINGKRTELVKKPHGLSMVDSLSATVQVEVAPGSIVNRVRNGDQWWCWIPGRRPSATSSRAASASSLTARMRCTCPTSASRRRSETSGRRRAYQEHALGCPGSVVLSVLSGAGRARNLSALAQAG